MRYLLRRSTLLTMLLAIAPGLGLPDCGGAQSPASPGVPSDSGATPSGLDAATKREVIEGVLARVRATYVFPEKAEAMERAIRSRDRRGEYDGITDPEAFADSLTAHLRAVSHDRHLRVRFSAAPLPAALFDAEPTEEERQRELAELRRINYGVEKVERLEGNIGYLDLRVFRDRPGLEETLAGAMDLLAHTDALIIDLRRNGGGDPEAVAKVASYLVGPDPIHLNSIYWRPGNRTEEFWTRGDVKGTWYGPRRPVYVLTSSRTFSGAEGFAYSLKALGRITIVGETTGGGAHPVFPERVNDHFRVAVPSGRAVNPITNTNWEGTGVEPDLRVSQQDALRTAHLAALRAVLATATDLEARSVLERVIGEVEGTGRQP